VTLIDGLSGALDRVLRASAGTGGCIQRSKDSVDGGIRLLQTRI
jgi:hypothetical protein